MLGIGDTAPEFELVNDSGETVTLSGLLADGPIILYFYPGDFTPVCTAEACSIRDMHEEILDVGVRVVGISPQGEDSHKRFKDRYKLPFPLLVDRKKEAIRAFGVNGPLGMGVRRATYLIAEDGTIANRVVSDLFVSSHEKFIKEVIANR